MSPMNGVMVVSGGKEGEREMSMTSKGKRGYETRTWCIPTYTQYISQVFIYSYMSTGGVCITLLISTWMHSNPRVPFSLVCILSSVAQGYPAHSSSSRALPQSPSQVFTLGKGKEKRHWKAIIYEQELCYFLKTFFIVVLHVFILIIVLEYGNTQEIVMIWLIEIFPNWCFYFLAFWLALLLL